MFLAAFAAALSTTGPFEADETADAAQSISGAEVPHIPRNSTRLLLLMIDGLPVGPFERLLVEGRLPRIRGLIARGPSLVTQAISTFPSATSPSVPELLSGRYAELDMLTAPGAVHAFDREERRVIRYVTQPDAWQWPLPNLFDATRGRPAMTVFEGRWDGPKSILTQFNVATQATLELLGAGQLGHGDRTPVEAFIATVQGPTPPEIALVVFNGYDMTAHFHGPDSQPAADALVAIDMLIGEIVDALSAKRADGGGTLLEHTVIMLFGDHGQVRSGHHVDLAKIFKSMGLKAVDVSTVQHVLFRERLGTLWTDWPDAILVSGGSNVTQVYLRQPGGGWAGNEPGATAPAARKGERIKERLAAELQRVEGVEQVIWMELDGTVRLLDPSGSRAHIRQSADPGARRFAYLVPVGATRDPLGYLEHPDTASLVCHEDVAADACFHTREEWFDVTFDSRFPGAVPLLPKAFHPQRFTGDIMVTLRPGYSFLEDQNGDHGNLERDAILTPFVLTGPGVRDCSESHRVRLVDIYPTAAVLLGARPDDPALQPLDGRVLDCARPR